MPKDEYVYYAITDDGYPVSNPMGVVRRRIVDGVPVDEAFTRNLKWEHSGQLVDIRYGHSDRDAEEISKQQADAFIERVTEKIRSRQR